MTVSPTTGFCRGAVVRRRPRERRRVDLDKGLVIDAFVRVLLVGIEVITTDARTVAASVNPYLRYLRFAEATGQLELHEKDGRELIKSVTENGTRGGDKDKAKGLDAARETIEETLGDHQAERREEDREPRRTRPRREREP